MINIDKVLKKVLSYSIELTIEKFENAQEESNSKIE